MGPIRKPLPTLATARAVFESFSKTGIRRTTVIGFVHHRRAKHKTPVHYNGPYVVMPNLSERHRDKRKLTKWAQGPLDMEG